MIAVGINGYGTIGKRVADAVERQSDMYVTGVSKRTADDEASAAVERGFDLYVADADRRDDPVRSPLPARSGYALTPSRMICCSTRLAWRCASETASMSTLTVAMPAVINSRIISGFEAACPQMLVATSCSLQVSMVSRISRITAGWSSS